MQTKCRAAYGAYINKIIFDPDDPANTQTGCNKNALDISSLYAMIIAVFPA